jgi:transposase
MFTYKDLVNMDGKKGKEYLYNRRRRMVESYLSGSSYDKVAHDYSTNRKTVMKWVERYKKYGWEGLKDLSRRPLSSPNKTDKAIEKEIVDLRRDTGFGAKRLKMEFGLSTGHNAIHRIIKEHGLINKHREKKKYKRNSLRLIKEQLKPFELIQIDIKYLDDIPNHCPYYKAYKLPRYQITARDVKSGAVYPFLSYEKSIASTITATDILLTHLKASGIDLKDTVIQTDNGSEFSGNRVRHDRGYTAFLRDKWGIKHRFIPPRYPNANADVETFHRIIESEFYSREVYSNIKEYLDKSFTYVTYFNFERKNSYRGYRTPLDYIKESKLNPMCLCLPVIIVDRVIEKLDKTKTEDYYLKRKDNYLDPKYIQKRVHHVPGLLESIHCKQLV